jgi:hypothetical protein
MDNTKDEKRSAGCSRSANLTHSVVMTVGRSAGDLAKILEVIEVATIFCKISNLHV